MTEMFNLICSSQGGLCPEFNYSKTEVQFGLRDLKTLYKVLSRESQITPKSSSNPHTLYEKIVYQGSELRG